MFPRLAFIAAPGRLSAADHRRRLESSALHRQREIEGEQAKQLSKANAFLYLSANYYERYPGTPMRKDAAMRRDPKTRHGHGPTNLGRCLRAYRVLSELTIRQLATVIETSPATLLRIEHGYDMDAATFMKVLNWLNQHSRSDTGGRR